jgi:hypothetical protein
MTTFLEVSFYLIRFLVLSLSFRLADDSWTVYDVQEDLARLRALGGVS